jgi:hypothetical protein
MLIYERESKLLGEKLPCSDGAAEQVTAPTKHKNCF